MSGLPDLGHGVGLRREHFERVLAGPTRVDWFEVISENFMVKGGRPLHVLERVRCDYPVVLHGVSLSIGSTDPLDWDYLDRLRELASWVEPAWVSDHLCWTGVGGHNAHDLLPLPYTEEALDHVVARVGAVQEHLGRRIALENVSTYLSFANSTLSEWEFLVQLATRADCGILLDVNNVYVSAANQGFDPRTYLEAVPPERVWQVHLAGHTDRGSHLLDSHSRCVCEEVWELYRFATRRFGAVASLVEWDEDIPEWDSLEAESLRAREVQREALADSRMSD
ncbi:MAG: DUF692 domain-containing protein [Deltaproteobacteria bacterium]|nr:MAG: DUF692 domain-containing protein [Deltaproteobacteria bacterium]